MADSGSVTTWSPTILVAPATEAAVYPYSGWTQDWLGTPGGDGTYGGESQITAGTLFQYTAPTGDTALAWNDTTNLPAGSVSVMPFADSAALAVVAGDATMATMAGSLANLYAGGVYNVSCAASCPNTVTGNLARFRLVTNSVTGTGGATTTYSTPITANGRMTWSFTVPVGTVAAYLAVENMQTNPENVVTFTRPSLHNQPSNTALGYLATANAIPLRTAQIKMPAYYKAAGWPTGALYQLNTNTELTWTPADNSIGTPATGVDPTKVTTAADLRFLAGYNYTQASGNWAPWYTSGVHSLTFHSVVSPYMAAASDNAAYAYQLSATQNVTASSLVFSSTAGTYLYSDDLNTLGLTYYTVILVLGVANNYEGAGGVWSSVPTAGGGGPDTTADLTSFNYRVVNVSGPQVQVESQGSVPQAFNFGLAPSQHKPTYLAMTFRDDANLFYYADTPGSVLSRQVSLTGVSGALNGSVVLGADATNGLASGAFNLFECGIYFGALTAAQVQREIQLLGQVYG